MRPWVWNGARHRPALWAHLLGIGVDRGPLPWWRGVVWRGGSRNGTVVVTAPWGLNVIYAFPFWLHKLVQRGLP